MKTFFLKFLSLLTLLLLASCESNQTIVNNIDEREANEIVVYLASKNIDAMKVQMEAANIGQESTTAMFNIMVDSGQSLDAMAALNRAGLPRREGTNLLELFAKSGLMSSDREETIRYQAGLAEELKNTIRKIDGVLDADVQLSIPQETALLPGAVVPKTTASVYVKHQGVLEDPNSHLEVKIKRLVAASVNGLDFENVTVISDRSRFADIMLGGDAEMISPKKMSQTYVSIWGVIVSKSSLSRFRTIFFLFILLLLGTLAATGWLVYKFYPQMKGSLFGKNSKEPPTET